MIIVRLAAGVKDHFPARRSEWLLATYLCGWGIILGQPEPLFDTSRAFSGLRAFASEHTWAWACLLIGAVRLLALLINGTFAHTWYGRYSPHVRGSLAFLSCFIWTAISIGILNSGVSSTGLVIYPGLLFLELTNISEALKDAGEVDRSRRDASP